MVDRPVRRVLVLVSVVAVLATGAVRPAVPVSAAFAPFAFVPARMAVLGDSITRGFNACGWYVDCESRSWAGGSEAPVRSHYARLRMRNRSLVVHNNAVSRAKVIALEGQARSAVAQRVDYVTILIGANDACTRSEQTMTSVADFESRFRAGMDTLRQGVPNALVFVSSIPDVKRLWQVGKEDAVARVAWTLFGVCRSMLFHPSSMAAADMDRRDRVRRRVIAYNHVLARVCAEYPRCASDRNAVFDYRFSLSEVSRWDFFHPNGNGQAALARLTFHAGFWSPTANRRAHARLNR
ncbi:GDSL-type esterase/lipase family protein [Actinomadura alba]|uniref:SGNH/GDSL hydrolase family protein n=1 Tax=Actinomadura alba TaxID=406431 RepID=A0ABR7LMD5_9ACTN|nr:GDSL-type esterase/lipase family protein [Actinomadura alba]MBC6466007.1 SGNH/GDSL hydrolase family protein [Actinomadura alba]